MDEHIRRFDPLLHSGFVKDLEPAKDQPWTEHLQAYSFLCKHDENKFKELSAGIQLITTRESPNFCIIEAPFPAASNRVSFKAKSSAKSFDPLPKPALNF